VEVADSYTLLSEDQPAMLATHLRAFLSESQRQDALAPSEATR
jgi:hypothetical protein